MGERLTRREVVVIDGRSGAGKSDYALQLATERGFVLVSLDEVYPGWDGLDAGQALVMQQVLPHWITHGQAELPVWNWDEMAYRGHRVIPDAPGIVVEGCGVLSARSAVLATESVWLEASEPVRFERAMGRDGEMYRPQWTRWALQEQRFIDRHDSPALALRTVLT
jgi:uridine kinase